ncbi:hypothetical protein JY97_09555 [Alkalispirochaeta odontotermitis]|nr:hypothetical protein JY97_09555 [Alkalispirochaeta odontotermitis]CAB1075391.1 hypothetical protein D1AOALGA4SA_3211 [Olavius algarvensis Delta 1 endosymbiont]
MALAKNLKRVALVIGSLVALIAAALVVILTVGISVNVDGIRARVETAASNALGRTVSIDGQLGLELSFQPALEVDGLKIANPSVWVHADFIKVDLFRASIRLLPLLRSRIRIQEITAKGIDIDLELMADGRKNWLFEVSGQKADEPATADDSAEPFKVDLVEIEAFALEQLVVSFRDHQSNRHYDLNLNAMKGAAVADEPLKIDIDGTFQQQRYYIAVNGDPIGELFNPSQSWHLEASAEMAGIILNVRGQADRPLEGQGFDFSIKINGDRIEQLAAVIGLQLPSIGRFQLAARMQETETGYSLSKLKGYLAKTEFDGNLDLNLAGAKPVLKAKLLIPTVDAGPLRAIAGQQPASTENQAADDPVAKLPELNEIDLSLDLLNRFDADIELKVARVINARGDIRDAVLTVGIHEGALAAPMQVTLADVAFHGKLDLKNYDQVPGFLLSLRADQTDLGNLALYFTNAEGVKGHLKSFEYSLGGAGHNLRALLENIDMQLVLDDAALSYGNVADGRPVSFTLKKAEAALLHDQNMRIAATGTLLDEPFNLEISGGSLNQILNAQPWPINLAGKGGGAKLQVEGTIGEPADPTASNLTLSLSGKKIGGLAAWAGISSSAKLPYALNGKLKLTGRQWKLNSLNAHLGKTKLKGQLGWKPDDTNPLLTTRLRLENVDSAELAGLAASDQPVNKEAAPEGFTFDMPIMPQAVELNDADVDIGIKRIDLREFDITNLSLTSRIRGGWVENSPFQLTAKKVQFKGTLSLDLRGKMPRFRFNVDSSKVNIGDLLSDLNVADGIQAAVGSFGLDLDIKGSNLRTIMEHSSFAAKMKDGQWTLQDPNTGASLQIVVRDCVVGASAGQPVIWSIDALIKDEPVKIQIKGDRLAALAAENAQLPLDISAEAAGVKLELSSQVELPLEPQKLAFKMLLAGERLSSINNFLKIDLPPYGPYELGGQFQLKKDGYYLSDLNVRVNQSHMTGNMGFNTVAKPPRLTIDLTTKTLQMDDFNVDGWSPTGKVTATEPLETADKPTSQPESDRQEADALLSPEFMRKLDTKLSLKVQEVLSGKDKLGSGNLVATLAKGRFSVDPMQLNVPGGSVKLAFAFEPTDTDTVLEASAKVDQFDYGILARRAKPDSDMGGWLSLDIVLKSRAPSLDTIMQHANGHIDFAVVPQDFEAGLFELWAVNLLAAALPELDSEKSSVVNCAVFQFDIKDGEMKQNAIFADTTKMQVGGKAKVNFKTQEVYLAMAPKAKKAEFFSLATPIQVKGNFSDYKIGVQPGGLLGTTFRFITSPLLVPIQRTFMERAPADGKAACAAAMQREHEK